MRPYQICTRCVMDTSDAGIIFDAKGACNHCTSKLAHIKQMQKSNKYSQEELRIIVKKIKEDGVGKKYDCILGISGGVDSSYLCHLLSKLHLRPLLVHFDNGWNTPFAVDNIQKLIDKLKFDYVAYKVDEKEFFELQKAYFRAGVIDIEVLTDQGLSATLYKQAEIFNIQYVISGMNFATETIMGANWNYTKWDVLNIFDICEKFANCEIHSYPIHNGPQMETIFTRLDLLNYLSYSKTEAIKLLESTYGWQSYPGKHYESYFTKFYQAYILPRKFGVDKRKAHLSDLIITKEITRSAALQELAKPLYTPEDLKTEKAFVLEKLGFSEEEFAAIMDAPPVSHLAYKHI